MAKIFISYSRLDKDLVNHYTTELRKRHHEILIDDSLLSPGKDIAKVLMEAQKDADGTLVFLTRNSVESMHVVSELGIAKAYQQNGKFFIPLVQSGVSIPYILEKTLHIVINEENFLHTVEQIEMSIQDFFSKKTKPGDDVQLKPGSTGERVKEVQRLLTEIGPSKVMADGVYGHATSNAVTAFQKDNHLSVTGEVDQSTYQALVSFSNKKKEGNAGIQQTNYWLLKINEKNWKDLKTGLKANFSTHKKGDKRPGYEKFQKIRTGDILLGFAYYEESAIVCIFLVTADLHTLPESGEGIEIEVTEVLRNKIPFSAFADELPELQSWVREPGDKLFLLSPEIYNRILNQRPRAESQRIYQQFSQTDFSTDSVDGKLVDKLNITVDVKALASVITYSKIKPPLAIGLFGTWGSGKSFFMKLLREEIDHLALDKTGTYCKEIVHVWFNSWYYSDANLWASLVTKIFEELKKKGEEKARSLADLYKKLNSAKELRQESMSRQTALRCEINALQKKATAISDDIRHNAGTLADISNNEIVKAVFKAKEGEKDINRIKEILPHPLMNNIQQINENLISIGSTTKRFYDCIKIIWSFRKGKLWIALATAVVLFAAPLVVQFLRTTEWETVFTKATLITGAVLAITSHLAIFILPLKNKIDTVHQRLVSLKQTVDVIEREEIAVKKELLVKVQSDIADREKKIQELQNDINEIATGKKLSSFIESRVTDQRYINSLGIISWIRKDFEELGALLQIQADLEKETQPEEKESDGGIEKIKEKAKVLEVNRIMLYIDDLDRCNKETVVRVLEAIHLLLAFDLFVVVVGVDPRWVYNALQQSYSGFLNVEEAKGTTLPPNYFSRQATPFDYLEKIFQIPFLLKPINQTGREDLIEAQFPLPTGESGHKPSTPTEDSGGTQPNVPPTGGTNISNELPQTPSSPGPKITESTQSHRTDATTISLLKLSREEIDFMKSISELIGDSPRTIKRFTNIYRIVRVHTNLEILGEPIETYCAVMIVLGIITGLPSHSNKLLMRIKQQGDGTLKDLVDKNGDIPADLKTCISKNYKLSSGQEKPAGSISLATIRLNLDLIIRFSFRSYELTEEMLQPDVD